MKVSFDMFKYCKDCGLELFSTDERLQKMMWLLGYCQVCVGKTDD